VVGAITGAILHDAQLNAAEVAAARGGAAGLTPMGDRRHLSPVDRADRQAVKLHGDPRKRPKSAKNRRLG
jgi:hypothetical protein